jgi:hypothetical protein
MDKRARNIKLAWIFFTASAVYIRGYLKYMENIPKCSKPHRYSDVEFASGTIF